MERERDHEKATFARLCRGDQNCLKDVMHHLRPTLIKKNFFGFVCESTGGEF